MKLLLSVSLFLGSVSAFAFPIRPGEAISGLQLTKAFQNAADLATSTLAYYDKLEITASPEEGDSVCYPNGLKSRSASTAKVVFINTGKSLKITKYFATSEQAKDFGACN